MSLNSESTVVIVGGGQAAAEAAAELRRQQYTGAIVLIGDETLPPYKRPPLSKAYLLGTMDDAGLLVSSPAALEKNGIRHLGGVAVTKIDRAAQTVTLADGREQHYDRLLLATGGRARPLPLAGADAPNVLPLRSAADAQAIRARGTAGSRVVVIGGGFIGLEVAAALRKQDVQVTVLEGLPRVLARVTSPEVSAFFERVHREAGVDLRTGAQVAALHGSPDVNAVELSDGSRIAADFVVVGIGLIANTELASAAGLAVDNGIVVDEHTQTSDPLIFAAGDCTSHPSEFLGRRVRLESVQNALEQGRAAARNLLGKAEAYRMVPWFWSDQYDLKLQMVGVSTGYDRLVLRGDPASSRSFAAFYFRDGKLIAADTVNQLQDFQLAKKMVAAGASPDLAQLADPAVPLKTLAG